MPEQPKKTRARLTQAQINGIASAATVHPKSVVKVLNGGRVRGDAGVRLDNELEKRGLLR